MVIRTRPCDLLPANLSPLHLVKNTFDIENKPTALMVRIEHRKGDTPLEALEQHAVERRPVRLENLPILAEPRVPGPLF